MLLDAGKLTHDEALAWANGQYDAFTLRRRLEAETAAEARYLGPVPGLTLRKDCQQGGG